MNFLKTLQYVLMCFPKVIGRFLHFQVCLQVLYPYNHKCNNLDQNDSALSEEILTLPEILLYNNYQTFGNSSHSRFSPSYGHAKCFEWFVFKQRNEKQCYSNIINEAIKHLESNKNDSNFLFFHFLIHIIATFLLLIFKTL